MLEHAIIETGNEREASYLTKLIQKSFQQNQQPVFCRVEHAHNILIDDVPLSMQAQSMFIPLLFDGVQTAETAAMAPAKPLPAKFQPTYQPKKKAYVETTEPDQGMQSQLEDALKSMI